MQNSLKRYTVECPVFVHDKGTHYTNSNASSILTIHDQLTGKTRCVNVRVDGRSIAKPYEVFLKEFALVVAEAILNQGE